MEISLQIGNYGSEIDSSLGCRNRVITPWPEHCSLRLLGLGFSCPMRIQEPDFPAFCVCPCSHCHQTLCHRLVIVAGAAAAVRGAVRNLKQREVPFFPTPTSQRCLPLAGANRKSAGQKVSGV